MEGVWGWVIEGGSSGIEIYLGFRIFGRIFYNDAVFSEWGRFNIIWIN